MSERERLRLREIARELAAAGGDGWLIVWEPPPWLEPVPFVGRWDDEPPEVQAAGERVEPC